MVKNKKNQSVYTRIILSLLKYRIRLVLSIIFILLSVFAIALGPYFIGIAINNLGEIFKNGLTEENKTFILYIILAIIAYVLGSILVLFAQRIIIKICNFTMYELRKQIDTKLQKLPLNYYDTTTYGDILSRLTNDVSVISDSLSTNIFTILNAVFTLLIVLIMMLKISGVLTFVGLATLPLLLIISNKVSAHSKVAYEKKQKLAGELNGYVEEYYSGHNIVKLFGKESEVNNNFDNVNYKLAKQSFRGDFFAGSLFPIAMSFNNFSLGITMVVGAIIAISGGLSIGMIQAFAQYLENFSAPISEVMGIIPTTQAIGAAATRVYEFLDEKEEIPDTTNPKFPKELKGEVVFDHVRFGYKQHQTLIHDLNIKVNPGEKTAIVGPTGAGKTTLVNLIMRFYDVKEGAIRIDGVDIRDMKREDLRKIFGMVLQDTWLYSGTIMENIRYGRLDATDEEVKKAAETARADGFIRTLPGGYNFVLQEGAVNIAQGQRQLLTIARAMLANPPILILDEATSSIDTRTEVLIQEAMANIMKGKTSFVIAHRLSTIKDSNNILYMQDGDILEVGNHETLMKKNGLYAKLYNSQFANQTEE